MGIESIPGGGGNDPRLHVSDDQPDSSIVTEGDLWSKTVSNELFRATDSSTFVSVETTGSGSMTTVEEGGVQVGGADIILLNFKAGFDITEPVNTEIDIDLDFTEVTVNPSTLILPNGAAPTPTTEADMQWETDRDIIVVGDAVGTKEFHPVVDATSDPLIDADAAADGTEDTGARKDHVHPKHHAKYTDAEAVTAIQGEVGAAESKADLITGQSDLTAVAGTDELLLSDAGTLKKIDVADVVVGIPYIIPIIMEINEGTNAIPAQHALATAAATLSGWVLVNGAGVVSTFNWKCASPIPDTLPSTPVFTVRTTIMTLAVLTDKDIRATLHILASADGENIDTDPAAETEVTLRMPNTTETLDVYDEVLGTTIAAGDFVTGQMARDSADALDNFTDDVQVVNMCLIITGS